MLSEAEFTSDSGSDRSMALLASMCKAHICIPGAELRVAAWTSLYKAQDCSCALLPRGCYDIFFGLVRLLPRCIVLLVTCGLMLELSLEQKLDL